MATHYEVLGIATGASYDEVRAAYRRLAATQRPPEASPHAKVPRKGKAVRDDREMKAWRRVQAAFDVLANPRRREPYDRQLAGRGEVAPGGGAAEEDQQTAPALDVSQLQGEELLRAVAAYFEGVAGLEPPAEEGSASLPPFEDASRFYDYWLQWSSRRDFSHAERHGRGAIAAGENRQVRRLMEAEDEKCRRQARKDYCNGVREAAKHAQQHDPRVRRLREERARQEAEKAQRRAQEVEAEEREREEARAEARRAARAAELERWAQHSPELETQASPKLLSECGGRLSSPGFGPLRCLPCQRSFETRDAWQDHASSKRHRYKARRWEEDGKGSILEGAASPSLISMSSPGTSQASPTDLGRLASPFQLPEASWLPSPALEPLPEPAFSLSDATTCWCLTAESDESGSPSVAETVATLSEIGRTASASSLSLLPPVAEPQVVLPSLIWMKVLSALGSRDCASLAAAMLSNAGWREGELGDPALWQQLARGHWDAAACSVRGPRGYLSLAASADEAGDLAALLGMDAGGRDRGLGLVRRQALDGHQPTVLDATPGLVASSQGDSEVRLFSSSLARLPPLRVKGKRVASLAIEPGCERLALGSTDGQVSICSLTDPEEMPSKLQASGDSSGFAGLVFLSPGRLVTGLRGDLSATLYDAEVRGSPVASSSGSLPQDSDLGLLTVDAVGGHGSETVLLVDAGGLARLWDVRAPRIATVVDMEVECSAAAVDPIRWSFVAASSDGLHWGDLRAQRTVALPVKPAQDAHLSPPLLACGPRGSVLAYWPGAKKSLAAIFAASHEPVQVHCGRAQAVPLAARRTAGGGPLLLCLAQPEIVKKWDFELCAVGVRAAAQLPSPPGGPRRPPSKGPAPRRGSGRQPIMRNPTRRSR